MGKKKWPYYLPGVGLAVHTIREYKSRKEKGFPWYNLKEAEDRKALKTFGVQTAYLIIPWILKIGIPLLIIKSNGNNKEQNNLDREINKTEQTIGKKNTLEKTVNYQELLKINLYKNF